MFRFGWNRSLVKPRNSFDKDDFVKLLFIYAKMYIILKQFFILRYLEMIKMDIEYKIKITDLEKLLLLEINERVKNIFAKVGIEDLEISKHDIKELRIDKNSLNQYVKKSSKNTYKPMANNLIERIDYIIESMDK
jgi:hypothetical protein